MEVFAVPRSDGQARGAYPLGFRRRRRSKGSRPREELLARSSRRARACFTLRFRTSASLHVLGCQSPANGRSRALPTVYTGRQLAASVCFVAKSQLLILEKKALSGTDVGRSRRWSSPMRFTPRALIINYEKALRSAD